MKEKKLLLWVGDAPNQRALAGKIAAEFPVAGIVIDQKATGKKTSRWKRYRTALQSRLFFKLIRDAWQQLQQNYSRQYPEWPAVPTLRVGSINSEEAFTFSQQVAPDLVIVSGTGLVKKQMLSLTPTIGIINLHTGLSPYVKGGPNCTNWCIATGQFRLIGNTIMWINEGIDSGNIITSERTDLRGVNSLADTQWRVMEHAHSLYLAAIRYLLNNPAPYISVPQASIAKGELYLTRQWDAAAQRKMLANLSAFFRFAAEEPTAEVTTVPLKK